MPWIRAMLCINADIEVEKRSRRCLHMFILNFLHTFAAEMVESINSCSSHTTKSVSSSISSSASSIASSISEWDWDWDTVDDEVDIQEEEVAALSNLVIQRPQYPCFVVLEDIPSIPQHNPRGGPLLPAWSTEVAPARKGRRRPRPRPLIQL
ncbi:hypothetical protein CYLTODRAFT_167135 [Cylindrobasidium torrendii FP15055 ss-10]|uniref:Uncharacterized protein n=1 Tax=Cylindrobasidium torrendii FP15055 ss-10 TaxID=1314674 RepID=A0A0D7AWU0_9AGAR|nr:hypothetical protein CYLTODRAFT_167135 [Cylindrobasidium torrendii FP15055 ss-10]